MVDLLETSQEDLAASLEDAPVPIHWVDAAGTITFANKAELALLGYARDEYVGQPIARFHADQARIEELLTRLLDGQSLDGERATLVAKDGRLLDVVIDSNAYCVRDQFVHSRCFTRLAVVPVLP
ncbi:MAG: PAS domain-containing protein [Chloroflexi bacterium]|nr:PAS domain-containing protein [Chloroflexota bacterium]